MAKLYKPAVIQEPQWRQIESAFASSSYLREIEILRRADNSPHEAKELFEKGMEHHGDESLNQVMYTQELPWRLKQVEECDREVRERRKLALVNWPNARQLRLPLNTPRKKYARYRHPL